MVAVWKKKKNEYDFILDEFWRSQKISNMNSTDYINKILLAKEIFSEKNFNLKNLKEKIYKQIFDIESETKSRFYYESINLIENYLDISGNHQYSLLLSLMLFTKFEKFLDVYNNMRILYEHFSSEEFFKKGFENSYSFDDIFKKVLINYYKICSLYTFNVVDKNFDEEINNNQNFMKKSFSDYMIESKLLDDIHFEENRFNLIGFFNINPQFLSHKDIRIKLYSIQEDAVKRATNN